MEANGKQTADETRPRAITIVAVLMILFGLAEVATGFTHNFIGLVTTSQASLSTYVGVALGLFYSIAGLLILTKRKWAAIIAIVLLCSDVIGRIAMVLTGLYPVNSFFQTFAIVIGTSIATFFAIYIGLKLKFFS
jgi:hypothetical protein